MYNQGGQNSFIPWTVKDILLAFGMLFLLVLLLGIAWAVILTTTSVNIDIGVVLIVGEAFLILPVWWFALRKYQANWRDLGIKSFKAKDLLIGLGLILIIYGLEFLYSVGLSKFGLKAQPDYTLLFKKTSFPWLVFWGVVVLAPIVEELFFRGFLFTGLRKRFGWKPAAFISAAIFAVAHFQLLTLIPIFLLGLVFSYLYQRSGSLWPGIIMHLLNNGVALGGYFSSFKQTQPPFY